MKELESQTEHWLPIVKGKIYFTEEMLQRRVKAKRKLSEYALEQVATYQELCARIGIAVPEMPKSEHEIDFRRYIKAHFPLPKSLTRSLQIDVTKLVADMLIEVYVERKISEVNNAVAYSFFHVVDVTEKHVRLLSYLSYGSWMKFQKDLVNRRNTVFNALAMILR
ncbi:MAG: hypothetical protein EOO50_05150 [Flavobacterium sp.]|uniref:hypothetical protein n=1 Tax=Flavobacterium sp. TaxID=239 RepID=UPI0012285846|nr:hypothetical protein [Flavobacterium sp.]RZJ67670.1 MAG: hypothetical protein EOO50_05150 [Flavobacterium sp.]